MIYCYEYPRPSVAADVIVCLKQDLCKILLIKRKNPPFQNMWALPGGFLDMNEYLIETAKRELYEETGLLLDNLVFFGIYDKPDRDPRGRTISAVYYAIIENPLKITAGDDASYANWFLIDQLPELAFDHNVVINDFIKKILT